MVQEKSFNRQILKLESLFYSLLFLNLNCSAQLTNSYKFIEPNISISYDTSQIKFTENYYNSFYNTEGVDFTFYKDTGTKSVIHATAQHPLTEVPDLYFIDSVMLDGMKQIQDGLPKGVRVVTHDSTIQHINTFSCAGFVMYDSKNKAYGTTITCNHLSNDDMTEVRYKSFADTSLKTGYIRLEKFLAGFKTYSLKDIQKEEDQIRKTYTVTIKKPGNIPNEIKLLPHTFAGLVQITPKPTHMIFGVLIKVGNHTEQLFKPDKENNLYITCRNENEGLIHNEGKVVFLNSFGKKVEMPFSFEYTK
jgi:hypothetical protein